MRSAGIVLALLLTAAAEAQQIAVTARAGVMNVMNDAYELIYGSTTPAVGAAARLDFGRRWSIALGADFAATSGELVIFTPDPIPSGFEADLTMQAVNLSAGVRIGPVVLSIGPTMLNVDERAEFDRRSITSYGGHVAARGERAFGSWLLGGELGYVHVSKAFGDEGGAEVQGDTDFRSVTAFAYAGYRF